MTSSGITAEEPQQNPVLVFSITLTYTNTHSSCTTSCDFGWRIHCGVEVTESRTNKQHTLSQKRVRQPVWIIHVLHAELASVRTLLVQGLDHSNLPSTLELVCDVPSLLHAHTQTKFRKCKYKFSRTHIDGARPVTHTHTQTPTQQHVHTTPSES